MLKKALPLNRIGPPASGSESREPAPRVAVTSWASRTVRVALGALANARATGASGCTSWMPMPTARVTAAATAMPEPIAQRGKRRMGISGAPMPAEGIGSVASIRASSSAISS